jgi:hypothetical protein
MSIYQRYSLPPPSPKKKVVQHFLEKPRAKALVKLIVWNLVNVFNAEIIMK